MEKEYKDLLICLDEKDFDSFISDFGSIIPKEYLKIIESLISRGSDQIQFIRIYELARFIFVERQSQHFGDPTHFEVDKNMVSFQEFIYLLRVFIILKIPFDVWKGLVYDAFEILKDLLKNGHLNCKKHPEYHKFTRNIDGVLNQITKDPVMKRKYIDFLNGAL